MSAPTPPDPSLFDWLYNHLWAPVMAAGFGLFQWIFKSTIRRLDLLEANKVDMKVFAEHQERSEQMRKEHRESIVALFGEVKELRQQQADSTQMLLKAIYEGDRRKHDRGEGG